MSHCSVCIYAIHAPFCSLSRHFDVLRSASLFFIFSIVFSLSLFSTPVSKPSPHPLFPFLRTVYGRPPSPLPPSLPDLPLCLSLSFSLFLFLYLSCASSISVSFAPSSLLINFHPPSCPLCSTLSSFITSPSFVLLLTPPFSTLPFSPSTSCNFCHLCLSTSISLTSDPLPPHKHTHSLHHCPSPSHLSLALSLLLSLLSS